MAYTLAFTQLQSFVIMKVWSVFGRFSRPFSTTGVVRNLESIGPAPGSTRQQNRVGRGPGGGRGKTSGRGQKGQKARHSVKPWFEGGQTPITRLFPKVGFRSKLAKPLHISLGRIAQLIDENRLDPSETITMKELYRARAVDATRGGGVKILCSGGDKLQVPVTIEATRATAGAIERIEELGGKFTAHYYNPLGLRALTRPEATLKKYGRLPLRARPTDRRNIEFYRKEEARGYMVDAPNAPQVKAPYQKRNTLVSPLVAQLEALRQADSSSQAAQAFDKNQKCT